MFTLRQTVILAAIALLFSSSTAVADADIVQALQDQFRNQTGAWFGPLKGIAIWVLISLATIAWTWSAAQMVLRNADLQEFVVELVRLVIFVGFFLALILNADKWSTALINGFMWTGNQAAGAGITGEINPAAILERGFILGDQIIMAAGRITALAFAILALVALVLYALIAAYALLVMAEMYIVTAAGVLLLGFGGSQWTADYAKRYITYCVSVGAKLYVLFLIVGLGEQFIYNWAIAQDKSQFSIVLSILGVLVMLVILVKMIPDIIQGVINGASVGSGTPSITGMGSTVAGAAAALTVGAAGGAMAVREASKLAGEQLGSSGPLTTAGAGAGAGTGAGTGAGAGTAASAGAGPLPMPGGASSSGTGRMAHAGQMLKNLNKAAGETIGGRLMGDYNSSHGSFGGSMAQKMRADRLGEVDKSPHTGGEVEAKNPKKMSGDIGPGNATSATTATPGWVAQTGGFNNLSPSDQAKAKEAHAEWQDSNPERNTFGVGEYVSYVQEKHQERQEAEHPYHSPAGNS